MKKRDWLIKYRGEKTQEAIALDSKISRALYAQIETGTRNPSVHTAKAIAGVLGFQWTLFFVDDCHETQQNQAI